MGKLQSLAKDTAIYGLSSIIGRFLNYLLVPLYTAKMSVESGNYGVVTNVYAWTAILLVLLTFGFETTFFRFASKENADIKRVFSMSMQVVGSLCALFLLAVFMFLPGISETLGYASNPEFIGMMAVVVALDALQAIPFGLLRLQKRPLKFAALKLLPKTAVESVVSFVHRLIRIYRKMGKCVKKGVILSGFKIHNGAVEIKKQRCISHNSSQNYYWLHKSIKKAALLIYLKRLLQYKSTEIEKYSCQQNEPNNSEKNSAKPESPV